METDSFFYQLLKQLPETLFALVGEPLTRAAEYRFDALEVKKKRQLVERLQANGQTLKEISQLLGISVTEVRRLARR